MGDSKLSFETKVAAPAAAVYRAFTDQNALMQWLCNDARTTVKEGGRVYFYWQNGYDMTGRFSQLVENAKVAFSWWGWGEPAATEVTVTLSEADGVTQVNLTHSGLGAAETWEKHRKEIRSGWESALPNLKTMLEKGVDKRIYDRPFMGIVPGGLLSAAEQTQLGVEGGLRLAQILDGSSMDAAGFQASDVLLNVGGTDIKSFPDLGSVLGGVSVGDELDVTFLRDGDKHVAKVTLGSRPLPSLPENPADFADQLAEIYAVLDGELAEILDGVDNTLAYTSPTEGEWSAAQVLGHLIVTERGTQMGIYMQISGGTFNGFPGNDTETIDSITTVYSDIQALFQFWKRTEAETVALLRQLPERFLERQIDYNNLGLNLLVGLPTHTRSHFPQIEAALALPA